MRRITSLSGLTVIKIISFMVLHTDRSLVEGAGEYKLYLSSQLQDDWRVHDSFQIMASCGDIASDECESLRSLLSASEQLTARSLFKTKFIDDGLYPGLWFTCHDGQDFQTTSLTNTADITAKPPTAVAGTCANLASTSTSSTCQAGSGGGKISTENTEQPGHLQPGQAHQQQQQQPTHTATDKPAAHETDIVAQAEAVAAVTARFEATKCAESGIPWQSCPHMSPSVKQSLLLHNLAVAVKEQGTACLAGQLRHMQQKYVHAHGAEHRQQQQQQQLQQELQQQVQTLKQQVAETDGARRFHTWASIVFLILLLLCVIIIVVISDEQQKKAKELSKVPSKQVHEQPSKVSFQQPTKAQLAPVLASLNTVNATVTKLTQSATTAAAAAAPGPQLHVSPPAAGSSTVVSAAADATGSSGATPDKVKSVTEAAAAALPKTNAAESPAAAAAAAAAANGAELAAAKHPVATKPAAVGDTHFVLAAVAANADERGIFERVSPISGTAATHSLKTAAAGSNGGGYVNDGSNSSNDDSIEGWQHVDDIK